MSIYKLLYRPIVIFLSLLLALLPGVTPHAQAYRARAEEELAAMRAMAARLGVDALFLTDPDAYQRRETTAAIARRDASLAELDQRYRPAPEELAALEAGHQAIRDAYALAPLRGIAQDLASAAPADPALLVQARAVLADYLAAERRRLDDLGAPDRFRQRLAAFERTAHAGLADHEAQRVLSGPPRQPAAAAPPPAALPVAPLSHGERTPRADRLAYLADEKPGSLELWAERAARALPVARSLVDGVLRLWHRLPFSLSPYPPLSSSPPTPEDLGDSPDVHLTAEVRTLAADLGNDPVRIFNYVHDNVMGELYYGSKKGSTGTEYEMAGNDTDQASLLIALLRAAGIPARYAYGVVRFDAEQAMELAGTDDLGTALQAFSTSGYPAAGVLEGGVLTYVEAEWTWVRAWLPYADYRGIPHGPGQAVWVDLDPAGKRYAASDAVDLKDAVPFDRTAYLGTYTTTLPVDLWAQQVREYAWAHGLECQTLDSASPQRSISPAELEILPGTTAGRLMRFLDEFATLPGNRRYTLQVSAGGAQATFELPATYGQRLTVEYPAATPEGQAVIDAHGDLLNTPPYLVELRPTIFLTDTVVSTGVPVHPGADQTLALRFGTPGISSPVAASSQPIPAGGVHAVVVDLGTVPQRLVDERTAALAAADPADETAVERERLTLALLRYFAEFDRARDSVAGIKHSRWLRDLGAGTASRQVEPAEELFGAPIGLRQGPYFVDVPKLTFDFYGVEGGYGRTPAIFELLGYNGSALEHRVWETAINEDGISAVKGLQLAAQAGQTLHTIDAGNLAILDGLALPEEVKDRVRDAVNAGQEAIVPEAEITRNRWTGVGYILSDPATKAGAYLINGGLNGGSGTGGGAGGGGGSGNSSGSLTDWIADLRMAYNSPPFNPDNDYYHDPVNLTSGDLAHSRIELTVVARGPQVVLAVHYHSRSDRDGPLGYGWTHTYAESLEEDPASGDVTYWNGEGGSYRFTRNPDGAYTPPPGVTLTLTHTVGFTLTAEAGPVRTFDDAGRITRLADPQDNTLTFNYDGSGRLATVIDAAGRTALTFSYNAENRIQQVTDLAGRSVAYTYDADGNLSTATAADGRTSNFAYDTGHNLIVVTDAAGNTDRYFYDDQDRMFRHVDAAGAAESFTYDPAHGQTLITDPEGRTRLIRYDPEGRILGTQDGLGNAWTFETDADGNRIAARDPRGHTARRTFDASGRLLNETDALGHTVTYTYDAAGRLAARVEIVDGVPMTTTYTYDGQGNLAAVTDPAGGTATFAYDAQGQRIEEINPNGHRTSTTYDSGGRIVGRTEHVQPPGGGAGTPLTSSFTYDAAGQMTSVTDPLNHTRSETWDPAGRPLRFTTPAGPYREVSYDARGLPASVRDELGRTGIFTFTVTGQLAAAQDTTGAVERRAYDAAGSLTTITDARGNSTYFTYDEAGRRVRTTDALGNVSGLAYCAASTQPCAEVDALGRVTLRNEDPLGRTTAVTDTLGYATRLEYDDLGRLTARTDALGRATRFAYDALGNLIRVSDPLNNNTLYTYTAGSLLSAMQDANGQVWTYSYDSLGRLASETDPLGRTWSYAYDAAGNRTAVTDANGATIQTTYDNLNRITRIDYPTGVDETWVYDSHGRLRSQYNGVTTIYYHDYDAAGRLIDFTDVKRVHYTYDAAGNVSTMTDPEGGVTRYTYDALNRLVALTDPGGQVTRFEVDALGRRTKLSYPNGVATYYTYNAAGHLTALVTRRPNGQVLSAFSYTYDAVGNRTRMTDAAGGLTTYTYDALDRLTGVAYPDGRSVTYTYDAVGNRLSMSDGGVTTTYTYDAANQLTQRQTGAQTLRAEPQGEAWSYTYDGNGNRLTEAGPEGTTTYTYDYQNRLTGVTLPDGSSVSFAYNALGRLVKETHGVATRWFAWERDHVLAEYGTGATPLVRYLRGPWTDEVLAADQSGSRTYYHADGLGSVVAFSDAQGMSTGTRSYDAFGAIAAQSGLATSRYGFTGRELVPGTGGLMYYRARWYDPAVGRFLTQDSERGDRTNPATQHRYTYGLNNPATLTDPSGHGAFREMVENTLRDIAINVAVALLDYVRGSGLPGLIVNLWKLQLTYYDSALDIYFMEVSGGRGVQGIGPVGCRVARCALVLLTIVYGITFALTSIAAAISSGGPLFFPIVLLMAGIAGKIIISAIQKAITNLLKYVAERLGGGELAAAGIEFTMNALRLYLSGAEGSKIGGFVAFLAQLAMAPELLVWLCSP